MSEQRRSASHGLGPIVLGWVVITAWLSWEYLVLNGVTTGPSFWKMLHAKGWIAAKAKHMSPVAGEPLSFLFGWIGFLVICLTNLYIVRKHLPAWSEKGKISNWLDFHIACGLLGPTFIVFHCNFQVRGLVAISFWSMMISFGSGIVGRYLYTQLLRERGELKAVLKNYEDGFKKLRLDKKTLADAMFEAFQFVGGSVAMEKGKASVLEALRDSLAGDFRLATGSIPIPDGWSENLAEPLAGWAVTRRQLVAGTYFKRMMGYWHSFHKPFAIFMYVVSVIHIIAALVFRVRH